METSRGEPGVRTDEARVDKGQVINVGTGMRTYWWEGAAWTSSHYFAAVGLDESEGSIYVHDGALGWFGTGKYYKMELDAEEGRPNAPSPS